MKICSMTGRSTAVAVSVLAIATTSAATATATAATHGGGDRMGRTAPGPGSEARQLMAAAAQAAPMATTGEAAHQTKGVDVAGYQGNLDWQALKAKGVRFAYVKVTENGRNANTYAMTQIAGAKRAGLYVGTYDYAAPSAKPGAGAAAARAFVRYTSGWKANTKTLPGTLDLEQSVTGKGSCYGLNQAQMRAYIADWTRTYKQLTGKAGVIYANPTFWTQCTGNTSQFNKTNPLWVAHWGVKSPQRLGGQQRYSLWQYKGAASGNTIDLDYFNGSEQRLALFANRSW